MNTNNIINIKNINKNNIINKNGQTFMMLNEYSNLNLIGLVTKDTVKEFKAYVKVDNKIVKVFFL